MRWCSGDNGDGDGDDDDDDPDEVQRDDDEDGDDLPPLGGNFPGRFLPAGELFSLSVVSAPWSRRNISSGSPHVLGFLGDEVREGGAPEVGQGLHTHPGRDQGGAAPRGGVGPSWPISASPFG